MKNILIGFMIAVVASPAFAQEIEPERQRCMERETEKGFNGSTWLPWADIEKIWIAIDRHCGIPLKNSYIIACREEGMYCNKAGDMVPLMNRPVKTVQKKPVKNSAPKPAPKAQPKSVPISPPAPAPKPEPVVKEVHHHKTIVKEATHTITVSKSMQNALDDNLEFFLNDTCKFVTQSPAFIQSNQETAIECAKIWAMVKNARVK